jgi:hypothetical protein
MTYYYSNQEDLVDGTWQEHWGMRFKWTSKHSTPSQLKLMIHAYDTVATGAVEKLDEIAPPPYAMSPPKDRNIEGAIKPDGEKKPRRDLYELMQECAPKDEKIGKLWTQINTIPEWVDWKQIERGQKVFFRYGGPTITTVCYFTRRSMHQPLGMVC